ncbi:hypothetical protein H1R17_06010 [Flavobacterium sp. xlx-214]|uniref:hypothetical protein n=1 Tax=unclassified Flavobacterium TaxID=196869 RepID=UPI0013D4F968|nr:MULTISPECIES: hypothetical protein [unclassified Flavobacterium]MBA5792995.1 hypothetical protein [Flavobacterium sp. xlx-221]QMI84675.1 hypothetical protein H1R17_06010 [Flavobacterium sp. xlx-214]
MKKLLVLFLCLSAFLVSCSKDEWDNRNPYLPEIAVNVPINTTLGLYNKLQYAGNAVYISGYGINGFFVINTGTGFRAFEATCANHEISSCSRLTLDGVEAKCSCTDGLVYNLFLGLPTTDAQYPLKEYRVTQNGSMLTVYN